MGSASGPAPEQDMAEHWEELWREFGPAALAEHAGAASEDEE